MAKKITVDIHPFPKQAEAWRKLLDKETRFVVYGGAAGGGKSFLGCQWLVSNCYTYPGSKWFIGRTELKRLMGSSYVTFMKVCKLFGIPDEDWRMDGKYNVIIFKNGSRIDLLDCQAQPRDPMFERFGSLEFTGGWLEEAGEIPFMAFDILKSRIGRHMNKEHNLSPSKMYITCNPSKKWLYRDVYLPWKKNELDSNFCFIQAFHHDNPHLDEEYKNNLLSLKDKASKERLMNGNWEYDNDPTCLIQYDDIIDVFLNHVDKTNIKYLSCDVARYGSDKTVIGLWDGMVCTKIYEHSKLGVDQVAERLKALSQSEGVSYKNIVVDDDGVGGGVADLMRGVRSFVNGSRAVEGKGKFKGVANEQYANLKTQCYYLLADYVTDHKIRVECDDQVIKEKIVRELEWVKSKDMEKEGKLKLVGKAEVKENLGRSPDFSDMMMMRMYLEIVGGSREGVRSKVGFGARVVRPAVNKIMRRV